MLTYRSAKLLAVRSSCLILLTLSGCSGEPAANGKEGDEKTDLCTVEETREQFYKDGAKPYSTSSIRRWFRDGRLEKRREGGSPGEDKIWDTADDPAGHEYLFIYDERGNPIRVDHYSSSGLSQVENVFDDLNQRTGFLLKIDTVETASKTYDYDEGQLIYIEHVEPRVGPGYTEFQYGGGRRIAIIERGPEHQGEEPVSWQVLGYDNGKLTSSKLYDGAGLDMVWGTEDDRLQSHKRFEYDPLGQLITETTFGETGSDGTWLTADDVASSKVENTFQDSRRIKVASTYHGGRFVSTFQFGCTTPQPTIIPVGQEWFEGGSPPPIE